MTNTRTQDLLDLIDELTWPQPVKVDSVVDPTSNTILGPLAYTGCVVEIDAATYHWFLGVLPPHFMERECYCHAEGLEPLQLFFARAGRYFTRRLTWDETLRFCRLARIPLPGF